MKLYVEENLFVEVVNFEDKHAKVRDIVFLKPVALECRLEDSKLHLILEPGDMLEISFQKDISREILRIFLGSEKHNYIFDIDNVKIVNIEERK